MGLVSAISNFKPMQNVCKAFNKDAAKALANTTIASVAIKDGIGCAMYVTQSLNNKKIPEERRKFVASLDLTNGLLMIAAQLALFFAMRKVNKPLFNRFFKKTFDANSNVKKTIVTKYRSLQKALGQKPSPKVELYEKFDKMKKGAFETFGFVTELVASTIIGKRVVVPFIATPLADKVKKQMDKHDAAKANQIENKQEKLVENTDVIENDKKLDIVSDASTDESNLLERYKLYYGLPKLNN